MNLNFDPLTLLTKEPLYTYNLLSEYLGTIDKYKHISTTATPVRIIVPDELNSIYNKQTDNTYDREIPSATGYKYKVYEYVPAYYSSPISFTVMNQMDTGTNLKSSPISLSVIGFGDVTIGSFVSFYSEYFERALFEVTNFRTPLLSNLIVPVFDLDLLLTDLNLEEFISKHKISQVYFFDYTLDKFLTAEQFQQKVGALNTIQNEIIPYLKSPNCFDYQKEIYKFPTNDKSKNVQLNVILLELIDKMNKFYFRLDFPVPFNSEILSNRDKYNYKDKPVNELADELKNLVSNILPSNSECKTKLKLLAEQLKFLGF